MKSKHLVIQIDIGQGTQWGNKETINPIREIFMPSVKKYCKKFDYDYVVINKSIYELKYKTFDFLETKNKHYSFERYFHFENDYDYTVYIDNDVYIYKDAEELPIIKGLMNAKEPEGNSSKIFREVNNLDFDVAYYNSGVTFCDNSTATFQTSPVHVLVLCGTNSSSEFCGNKSCKKIIPFRLRNFNALIQSI